MIGTAFKLWVILNPHIKRTFRQLYGLHQPAVRRETAQDKPLLLQQLPVIVVEFIAMPDRKSVV